MRVGTLLSVTETGGEVGLVRDLPGVPPGPVRALVEALASLDEGFARFAGRLEAGAVHEHAFGRLIDAAKVRDAYHDRLPKTKINLAEASGVARSFLAEFTAPAATPVPTSASAPAVPPPREHRE